MDKFIYLLYLKRIIKSLSLNLDMSDDIILYSSSDFLPDVIPAFILKFKNNGFRLFAIILMKWNAIRYWL